MSRVFELRSRRRRTTRPAVLPLLQRHRGNGPRYTRSMPLAVRRQTVILITICTAMFVGVYSQGYGLMIPLFAGRSADITFSDSPQQIAVCNLGRRSTCLVDGDTGWESGRKWRLLGVDTPEISKPECAAEYNIALMARDRLAVLMSSGYSIVWSGRNDKFDRALVDIELPDGASAAQVLLNEGLAQTWPNAGNVWCEQN